MVDSSILSGDVLDISLGDDQSLFSILLSNHAVGILTFECAVEPFEGFLEDFCLRLTSAGDDLLIVQAVLVVQCNFLAQVSGSLRPVVAILVLGIFLYLIGCKDLGTCRKGKHAECKCDKIFLHIIIYILSDAAKIAFFKIQTRSDDKNPWCNS